MGTREQSEVDGAKRSETLRRTRLVREQARGAVSPALPERGRDDQSQGVAPRETGPHQQGETGACWEVVSRPESHGIVRDVPPLRRGPAQRAHIRRLPALADAVRRAARAAEGPRRAVSL